MVPAIAHIGLVVKSEKVVYKIAHRAGRSVTPQEVDEAAANTLVERSWWDHDHERGDRLMVAGRTAEGRSVLVVLYPVDVADGTWRLGTAIPQD